MRSSAVIKLLGALNNFLHFLHVSFQTVSLTLQYTCNKFVIRCLARVPDDLFPAGKIMSNRSGDMTFLSRE